MRQQLRAAMLRVGKRGSPVQRRWYCSAEKAANEQVPPERVAIKEDTAVEDNKVRENKNINLFEEAFMMTAESLVEAYRSKRYKSEEIVEECIRKLQTDGALYNSVTSINLNAIYEAAILDESFSESGKLVGPLHGVPFIVGDAIHVAGLPTTCGSNKINYNPSQSAPVVTALKAAGAICVGKANQDEFGLGFLGHNESTGTILNPLNPKHYAGGSQGGAAVAVCSGCVTFSIGIDVVGDVRIPASFCNVIGFVPEVGAYSTARTWSLSSTLGNIGIIARSVDDISTVDGVMRSTRISDDVGVQALFAAKPQSPIEVIDKVRLCVPEDGFAVSLDQSVELPFRSTLMMLQMLNCSVTTSVAQSKGKHVVDDTTMVTKPREVHEKTDCRILDGLLRHWFNCQPVFDFEVAGRLLAICQKAGADHAEVINSITVEYAKKRLNTKMMFSEDLKESETAVEWVKTHVNDYWEAVDKSIHVLVFPTTVTPSPTVIESNNKDGTIVWRGMHTGVEKLTQNTGPVSIAGLPSITVPLGKSHRSSKTGLGLLVVGRPGETAELLESARAIDAKIKAAIVSLGSKENTRETMVEGAEDWLEDASKNQFVDWVNNKMSIARESDFRHQKLRGFLGMGKGNMVSQKALAGHSKKSTLTRYTNSLYPRSEYPDSDSPNIWKEHTPEVDGPKPTSMEEERLQVLEAINRKPDPNRKPKVFIEEPEIIRPHDKVPADIAALGVGVPSTGPKGFRKLQRDGQKVAASRDGYRNR